MSARLAEADALPTGGPVRAHDPDATPAGPALADASAAAAGVPPPRLLFVVRGAESYGTETKILGFFEALTARGLRPGFFALGEGRLVERARALPGLTVHVHPTAPPRFVAAAAGEPPPFGAAGGPLGVPASGGPPDFTAAREPLGFIASARSPGVTGEGEPHSLSAAGNQGGSNAASDPRRFIAAAPRPGSGGGKLRAFTATLLASAAWMRGLSEFLATKDYEALAICEHGLVLQTGLVARRHGVPAYWIMANGVSGGYRWDLNRRLYAFAFRHLNVIPVANSDYTRATLGRGARHAARIDLGVNPRRLSNAAPAMLTGLPPGAIRLLVMSRLVPGKGHHVLLAALLSRPEFAAIHLILCGGPLDTPYAQSLHDLAAAHCAAGRLHLVGEISNAAAWYGLADVVVNARLDPEPFGLSIVEAMVCGRPVLAHAAGGPAEIVVDGVTGWHVTSPDPAGFAAGLARMLADRARWPAMGEAGRCRAQQRYTHDAMTDQFLAIAAGRRPPGPVARHQAGDAAQPHGLSVGEKRAIHDEAFPAGRAVRSAVYVGEALAVPAGHRLAVHAAGPAGPPTGPGTAA
jgi:glycosyltransferase involved in cell wall biosynthesis